MHPRPPKPAFGSMSIAYRQPVRGTSVLGIVPQPGIEIAQAPLTGTYMVTLVSEFAGNAPLG